jgi:hypothetical protein
MKKKLTVLVAMLAMMLFAAAPAFADTALVNIGPLNAEGEGVISAEAESVFLGNDSAEGSIGGITAEAESHFLFFHFNDE